MFCVKEVCDLERSFCLVSFLFLMIWPPRGQKRFCMLSPVLTAAIILSLLPVNVWFYNALRAIISQDDMETHRYIQALATTKMCQITKNTFREGLECVWPPTLGATTVICPDASAMSRLKYVVWTCRLNFARKMTKQMALDQCDVNYLWRPLTAWRKRHLGSKEIWRQMIRHSQQAQFVQFLHVAVSVILPHQWFKGLLNISNLNCLGLDHLYNCFFGIIILQHLS